LRKEKRKPRDQAFFAQKEAERAEREAVKKAARSPDRQAG
jgi:hypothetical protein